jgi:uncharacterized membrane protein
MGLIEAVVFWGLFGAVVAGVMWPKTKLAWREKRYVSAVVWFVATFIVFCLFMLVHTMIKNKAVL